MDMNTDGKPRKLVIRVGSLAQALIRAHMRKNHEVKALMRQISHMDLTILPGTNLPSTTVELPNGGELDLKEVVLKPYEARRSKCMHITGNLNRDDMRISERRIVIPGGIPEVVLLKHQIALKSGKSKLGTFVDAPGMQGRRVEYIVRTKDEGVSYRFRKDFAGTDWNDFIRGLGAEWRECRRMERR